jgi:hypothetical protein
MGYEKSEKMPKGVTASDMTGQKRVGASSVDKEKFHSGASGEKMPKGALASDMSGERRAKIVGGVGMGSKDSAMRHDTGKQDGFCGEM